MKIIKWMFVLLLVLMFSLYAFVRYHSAADIPMAELSERWANDNSFFLDINGLPIHVRDEGVRNQKLPIVLIHGTSASLHTWDGWVSELRSERRVIRFDLPGFGLTGPEPNDNYTIEQYTDYVAALLSKLEVPKAILAGNSLGGYIAWATAVRYPDIASKLVLVDTSGYPFRPKSIPIAFKLSQVKLAQLLLKDFIPQFVVRSSVENVYGNPALVTDALVERYYQLALREGNRDALKKRFGQTKSGDLRQKISTISTPTLLLWGAKDRLIPPEVGQKIHDDLPNSQLVMFDELGHVPHEEDPAQTLIPVKAFINQ